MEIIKQKLNKLMSNLEIFSNIKRRNQSISEYPEPILYKNASQNIKLSLFSKKIKTKNHLSRIDNSKILPKNMFYDKQSLYLEVLSLKIELNQIMDQNIRLKTKNIALQKQIEVWQKKINAEESNSTIRINRPKGEKLRNNQETLKKFLKEIKKKQQQLRSQNTKMKKLIKISKINELEIQNSLLFQQNRKLSLFNEQLQQKAQLARLTEQKNRALERNKISLLNQIKSLEKQLKTAQAYVQSIQLDRKYDVGIISAKKGRRTALSTIERHSNSQGKNMQHIRRNFLLNRDFTIKNNKKDDKIIRIHNSIHPLRKEVIGTTLLNEFDKDKSILINQKNQEKNAIIKQYQPHKQTVIVEKEKKQKQQGISQIVNVKLEEQNQNDKEQFIQQNDKSEMNEYNSVQGLYQGDKKLEGTAKAFSQPEYLKFNAKSMFKSNKKLIDQICQLLTFRMMAQRYTFNELKLDIQKSPSKQFTYIDLCHMLVNQPFYLTVQYCRTLLNFMFQKQKPIQSDQITTIALIAKLRKVINDFQIVPQQQQKKMLENCANVITQNVNRIKEFHKRVKNQDESISMNNLKQILTQIHLSQKQINLIIGELAICSNSLQNLNIEVLFERFDLNQVDGGQNAIEQVQNEDSYIHKSKNRDDSDSKLNGSKQQLSEINIKKHDQNSK